MKALGLVAALLCVVPSVARAQTPPVSPVQRIADTTAAGLIPAGRGTLRQEEIAIKLQLSDFIVRLTPLDESVIRTLLPDSYRALRDQGESRRRDLTRLAQQHGQQRGTVWYVEFFGLAPDARFSPEDLTITAAGREFRPLEVVPLTGGFGSQRLQPRERQAALYLFDDAVDVNQPLTITFGTQTSTRWTEILKEVEKERALVRSRG